MDNDIIQQIIKMLTDMHLNVNDAEVKEFVVKAERLHWSADKIVYEFASMLLQRYRIRSLKNRITRAHFAQMLYLDTIDHTKLSKDAEEKLSELKTLEFIEDGKNVIFAGVTGTQKTHMAIGLGIKACQQGYRVLYTTIPNLILQLRETKTDDAVQKFTRRLNRFHLLICDEYGYLDYDNEGKDLLYTLLTNRIQVGRAAIFCMLSDESWETMNGKVAAAAVLYRKICEGAIHVDCNK